MKPLTAPFLPPVPVKDQDDASLMLGIAARHRASFNELHRRLAGVVYTTAFRVLNNGPDAEEVAQDVFVQIWEKAPIYDVRKGKPLTWAGTMARNRAIDKLRANARRCRLGHDFETELAVVPPHREISADEEASRHDDATMLRTALEVLTPEQKVAVELVYYRGMTQKDAAEILHQPVGTVKARIRRAIVKLREYTRAAA